MHENAIVWESDFKRSATRPIEGSYTNENVPLIIKKNYNHFRYNELPRKVSPSTIEVCDPLQKLTSLKYNWTCNSIYQKLYESRQKHHQEECNDGILQ